MVSLLLSGIAYFGGAAGSGTELGKSLFLLSLLAIACSGWKIGRTTVYLLSPSARALRKHMEETGQTAEIAQISAYFFWDIPLLGMGLSYALAILKG